MYTHTYTHHVRTCTVLVHVCMRHCCVEKTRTRQINGPLFISQHEYHIILLICSCFEYWPHIKTPRQLCGYTCQRFTNFILTTLVLHESSVGLSCIANPKPMQWKTISLPAPTGTSDSSERQGQTPWWLAGLQSQCACVQYASTSLLSTVCSLELGSCVKLSSFRSSFPHNHTYMYTHLCSRGPRIVT